MKAKVTLSNVLINLTSELLSSSNEKKNSCGINNLFLISFTRVRILTEFKYELCQKSSISDEKN